MSQPLAYFFDSLYLIKPETSIIGFLVLILLYDLIFKKEKWLPYISLFGLVVTLFLIIEQYGYNKFAFQSSTNFGMMAIDPFGAFFKIIILLSSIIVILFSILSKELDVARDRMGEYYTLIFGMILGMFLMVSASDLILIYIAVELVSLSSFVLAGFLKNDSRSSEASLKYIIFGGVSSGIMLFGISILYGITGTTNLYEMNSLLQNFDSTNILMILTMILIFAGIGYKISAVPFHFWTPDVYEGAPVTITAYLSVASKAAGIVLLIRLIKSTFVSQKDAFGYWEMIPAFDWQGFLIIISILTMTIGNFSALWQSNVKRMLAYSSIAHAGYILAAIAVLSDQGLVGVMVYFIIYLLMNLGAFLIVIVIKNKINSEELEDYDGLGYRMPLVGVAFTIFLISLTGIPPTAGFIGKLYVFIALVDAKMLVLAVIMLLNSVVSLYYYVRILKHLYLNKPKAETTDIELSFSLKLFILVLAVPNIIFGLYFAPILEFVKTSLTVLGI